MKRISIILSILFMFSTWAMAMSTRDYFNKNCASCHGKNATLAPISTQTQPEKGHVKGKPMKEYVLKGKSAVILTYWLVKYRDYEKMAKGNDGIMNHKVGKLSDKQIAMMVAYIRSISNNFNK